MNSYRIRVQPNLRFPSPLTEDALTEVLADASIRELSATASGHSIIDLQLMRPTHEEALDDILFVVQQLGYAWLEAEVREWTDATVEGLVLGALGGFGTAGSVSENPEVLAIAAIVAALAGGFAGSQVKRVKVLYAVRWTPTGWQLTEVPQPQRAEATVWPGLAS
jgi:hypothetical protein